ncbi:MAG: MFS transporter [Myxococcales bacterium]|nr:MFS transporter [Myxococcales bacterium]
MNDAAPDSAYHRRLLVFLSVASFFEGYDFFAFAQLLPNIRAHYGLTAGEGGALVALVNAGTMIAYVLVRTADRWGRKRVLALTILGYAVCSFLSGLAPNAWSFGLLQLLARVFLIGEWAVSMVVAAEEFPAERRGSAMGIIQGASTLGAIVCAGVVPLLLKLPTGWRTVYFVGAIPLMLLAFARRTMRETKRFEARAASAETAHGFFDILKGPHRRRVLLVALVWALTYVCTQNAVTFWKEFAVAERAMTDGDVGLAITIAAVGSLPLVFLSGKLIDKIGRRGGSVVIFLATSAGTVGAYTLASKIPLTISLIIAIFGTTAVLQVLNAFTAELFPTEHRADAFAWSNNLLGRIGYVLSPYAVGVFAERAGWGIAVSSTAVFPLIALVLILAFFPETKGKELEETAAAH